jgi:nucleotide-binding universal stress UspA family protein
MKRLTIRNILVPVDFSKMSIGATNTAKHLARRFAAKIHLVHVRQFDYAGFSAPVPPLAPFSLMTYPPDDEKSILKEMNALARNEAISAICHVITGGPAFDQICRLAHKIPADLIVMPTHGRTGLKHVVLGSTAERIVQHSPCPVLVARRKALQSKNGSRLTTETILVPMDFSNCSRGGLEYAIGFAKEFGAKIILLHATYLGYVYLTEGTAIYDVRGLQENARQHAALKMRELVRMVKAAGVKVETTITEASPFLDICGFAKDHNVDLIVTSTHGLTGLKHVLIGSVAEKVVRHAACSVLVVPSHPQVRAANVEKSAGAKARKVASSPPRIRPVANQRQSGKSPRGEAPTRALRSHARGRASGAYRRMGNGRS